MKIENQDIESLFEKAFREHRLEPDVQVMRNVRFRLWKQDFFSLSMRKFNIAYASILVGGVIAVTSVLNKENLTSTSEQSQIAATFENVEEQIHKGILPKSSDEEINDEKESSVENAKNLEAKVLFAPSTIAGCMPLKVKFKDKSANVKDYLWEFGDGATSSKKNPTHIYKKPGRYTVLLSVRDNTNTSRSFKKTIKVYKVPTSDFSIDIDKSDIESREVVFINKSVGAETYTWKYGDNTNSSVESASHVYNNYKSYSVALIAKSSEGCLDTAVITNNFIAKDYLLSFPTNFRPDISGGNSNNGYYSGVTNSISIFYPQHNGVKDYQLSVFLNKGTKIFTSTNIQQGWNGYIRGRLAPAGIYLYEAQGTYPNGKTFYYKGKVKLLIDNYQNNY